MTPDSVISWMRSLPSRERSPTPANTDTPACSWATLRISSWMMTVLPTPAPPKMPILPPFLNGQIRSMTLRPVSKTSTSVVCWSNGGRGAVDRQRLAAVDRRPCRRSALPRTSKTRPSVTSPTGTEIGPPVSRTAVPRARPSVVVIATERTQLLPRCCWTSQTSGVLALALDLDGVVDRRQLARRELDVDDRPGDLDHPAGRGGGGGRHGLRVPPRSASVARPSGPGRRTRSRSSRG